MQILYVEDEPSEAELVAKYIQTAKYDLIYASNISEAQDAVNGADPDLILMDVIIGNSRAGLQLARDLRQRGYERPMIAVTGLVTAHDTEECYKAGFTDILPKPFTINQLADKLREYSE